MKKTSLLAILLLAALLCCPCAFAAEELPATHTIPANPAMGTLDDEDGADAFGNELDHGDSVYFAINDYYNMESGGSLHILSRFDTYQQTTEYTCGCAAALMVLHYYGITDYDEMEICELAGTDTEQGTSVEGLASFLEGVGLKLDVHADTACRFDTIEDCEAYLIDMIDSGCPVMADWVDWGGHWQAIIGVDTCGTESPYDDVLIMADPYDVTDHFQDGYYIVPFGRFFYMWREGPCAQKDVPYEQPFVVAYRPK